MNDVFIELYLDEDVDVLVADLVCARSFSAVTTRDADNLRLSDAEQLAHAVHEKLVMMTHNRSDFERLIQSYYESDREHHGVIIAVRRKPHDLVHRLLAILNQVTADEMRNQVRYI